MTQIPLNGYLIAFLGGLIPALLWLWFWHREDRKHPEPTGLVVLAFITGMVTVPIVVPFEKLVAHSFVGATGAIIVLWAVIEEAFKFVAARISILGRAAVDEPVDEMVYMITVALGFAALENTLFMLGPIGNGDIITSFITGNFRFIGATLLHTLASATVGIFLALGFYKPSLVRRLYAALGLILAIALHAVFNFFIMKSTGGKVLYVFLFVWLGIIVLLAVFEKVKRMRSPRSLLRTP